MIKGLKLFAGDKGFTLIEMLVTVTIIGVLAAVVTVGVSGASSNAQTQANKQLFASVQTGIDAYAASTPSATTVPGTAYTSTTLPATAGYYIADGATLPTFVAGDIPITFTSTTNNFNTFFRLNNTSGTFNCVALGTAPFTLKACHN